MASILSAISCYIKKEPYRLCICIDNDSNENSVPTTVSWESTSNDMNIRPRSIRLHFKLSTDKKQMSDANKDDPVPETIILDHVLNIQLTGSSTRDNLNRKKNCNEDPIEKSSNEPNSSSLFQYFGELFSEQTSEKSEEISSESTQVDLSYVEICESFRWKVKSLQLEMNSEIANQFCLILTQYLSKLKHRPRHLLTFVNPQCGKDKGRSVYEEEIFPLFKEANINVETVYTERVNHARDYINEQSLDAYDGLVCVGGDGMFSELCHGLLLKTARQAQIDMNNPDVHLVRPNFRIGVIPAGSTDAVVFATTGHNDPVTSALQIIVGESLFIDITTVHNQRGFVRFMATMLSYGFFANIIQQSDSWRVFGPLRYSLAGFFQFVRNTSYHTALTIIGTSQQNHSEKFSSPLEIKREDQYTTINCLNMPCRCEKSKYGMSPSVHLGDGSFDLILVKRSQPTGFFRFLHRVAHDGRNIEQLANVERFRATKVIIRPIVTEGERPGNWACDGELITSDEVTIRAHHQALNLFASGISLDQVKQINEEK